MAISEQQAMEQLIAKHGDKVKHSINRQELLESAITGPKQDTRFQPGQSGNPSGRTLGSKNRNNAAVTTGICADVI